MLGANTIINENDDIFVAIPSFEGVSLLKILANGTALIDDIITVPTVRNPQLALGINGFYLLYMANDGYYVSAYDNNLNEVWASVYVGNETAVGSGINFPSTVIKPDGEGGIFVMWAKTQLYLQRINKQGQRLFGSDGLQISTNAKSVASPRMSVDTQAKAVDIAWYSNNTTKFLTSAQKISFDGDKLWGEDGVTLFETPSVTEMNYPVAIANTDDNQTLLVVSKYNLSTASYDLVAANLKNDGTHFLGGSGFMPVNTAKTDRYFFNSTDYFHKQIVVAWASAEGGGSPTLVNAQNVSYHGHLGPGASDISDGFLLTNDVLSIFPNPVESLFTVNYFSDFVQKATLRIFDIEGKLQYTDDTIELNQGENNLLFDCNLPKGAYSLELQTSNSRTNRAFVVR
jgi:hypothetical protein